MKVLKFILPATLLAAGTVPACDLCNVYSALEAHGESSKGWHVSLAEQFTHFGTIQEDSVRMPNSAGQYLDSSVTQIVPGYNVNDWFGVQVNVPFIHRWFRRTEDLSIDQGSETGIGDLSLVGHVRLVNLLNKNTTFVWHVLGGVKLPTGDSRRIAEELNETPPPPGATESGIHGHDLALGSGSVDGIVGTSVFGRWHRVFLSANVQYAARTKGDFDYQYADDLTWSGGPGVFLALEENYTISLEAIVSGETKGLDTFMGMTADDTGITAVYVGPQIRFTCKDKFSAEIGIDLPVNIANTSLQSVPDYRIRGALSFRF